jgi:hypothetical protein
MFITFKFLNFSRSHLKVVLSPKEVRILRVISLINLGNSFLAIDLYYSKEVMMKVILSTDELGGKFSISFE